MTFLESTNDTLVKILREPMSFIKKLVNINILNIKETDVSLTHMQDKNVSQSNLCYFFFGSNQNCSIVNCARMKGLSSQDSRMELTPQPQLSFPPPSWNVSTMKAGPLGTDLSIALSPVPEECLPCSKYSEDAV